MVLGTVAAVAAAVAFFFLHLASDVLTARVCPSMAVHGMLALSIALLVAGLTLVHEQGGI